MKYENPEACSQSMQLQFFNMFLKMMTQMGKSVRAEELPKVLKHAKSATTYCCDIIRNDISILNNEEAEIFWNKVYHLSNE